VARVAARNRPLILTALGNEFINRAFFQPTDEAKPHAILKYARGPI